MHDVVSLGFQAVAAALLGRKPTHQPPAGADDNPGTPTPRFRARGRVPVATTPEERQPAGQPQFHRNEAGVLAQLAVLTARPGGDPLAAAQALWGTPEEALDLLVADIRPALAAGGVLDERHAEMLLSLLDAASELPLLAQPHRPTGSDPAHAAGIRAAHLHLVDRLRVACDG